MARVLIAEDEVAVREFVRRALAHEGHDVTAVSDGLEALATLKSGTFDLLITDIIMPNKEGLEIIREVKKKFPSVKIIAMSGGNISHLDCAELLGAVYTLSKPFSKDELIGAINSANL